MFFLIFTGTVALKGYLYGVLKGQDVESNHVILISIDELAAYHLENEDLELPNLRELIEAGVWAEGVQSVFPSVTDPCIH